MPKAKQASPLAQLIDAADRDVLKELICQLAATRPEVRRTCVEFLQKRVSVHVVVRANAQAEVMRAIWDELEPDLQELDEYGGGNDDLDYRVNCLLGDLAEELEKTRIPREDRRALLDDVISYIRSGNSGMEDDLYKVAYAACKDDEDWRDLAERLEALGQEWPTDHARCIYRRIGDGAQYLKLRKLKLETGADFCDLALFYWETGEKEKALATGRKGLIENKGNMSTLRGFMSERAKESGNREEYLELQLAEAAYWLTLKKYVGFQKLCKPAEWRVYEPRLLKVLPEARREDRLEIYLHRKEFDQALAALTKWPFQPSNAYDGNKLLQCAKQLEDVYPKEILAYYQSGLGKFNASETRKVYSLRAEVAKLVRHMWVDVLKDPKAWEAYARQIKAENTRRSAFQEEFARKVPGWREL